ncbi:MAG: succinate dehydrogenase, hydrophobic membrane anchor protein [Wolbachia pipientis]|nr:succinate dehydrogenase, hydrophobic membrane anchor protein [Wolbachia pipientis]
MIQSRNSIYRWWVQRISAVILLLLFPWFIYLYLSTFYTNYSLSFNEKLLLAIGHPLELLFFIVLLFCIFWHAALGMQVICEDYIYSISIRVFIVTCIKYLSSATYIVLAFTVLFFYRRIFLL